MLQMPDTDTATFKLQTELWEFTIPVRMIVVASVGWTVLGLLSKQYNSPRSAIASNEALRPLVQRLFSEASHVLIEADESWC